MRDVIDTNKDFIVISDKFKRISQLEPGKINQFFYGHPYVCQLASILAGASMVGLLEGYNAFLGTLVGTVKGTLIPVVLGGVGGGILIPLGMVALYPSQALHVLMQNPLTTILTSSVFALVGVYNGASFAYQSLSPVGSLIGSYLDCSNYIFDDGLGSFAKLVLDANTNNFLASLLATGINVGVAKSTRLGFFANHEMVENNLQAIGKIKKEVSQLSSVARKPR